MKSLGIYTAPKGIITRKFHFNILQAFNNIMMLFCLQLNVYNFIQKDS